MKLDGGHRHLATGWEGQQQVGDLSENRDGTSSPLNKPSDRES